MCKSGREEVTRSNKDKRKRPGPGLSVVRYIHVGYLLCVYLFYRMQLREDMVVIKDKVQSIISTSSSLIQSQLLTSDFAQL